jgi:hypothetical protein
MTDDRSLERAARSWLEDGPTQAPDRAVEAALLRIDITSQERDLRIPRRLPKMSTPARVAAAAVIGVLAIGGAFYLISPGNRSSVGVPGPSPTPSPSASPSASASASLTAAAAPARTWGDWQATSQGAIAGLYGANEHIQLSIDWQYGLHTWIQTTAGGQVLKSETLQAPAGEIDLRATGVETVGCAAGDLGRYRWSRSADGLFLTLTLVDDPCANRAEAMARTWVHSLSAVNDGGTGVFPIDGWLKATLPSVRWALDDTGLHTFDASDPAISFVVIKDPLGYDQPCGAVGLSSVPGTAAGGAASVTAYADYLRARPGLDATVTMTKVDGREAAHVVLTPKPSFACPSASYALFRDGVERDVAPGQRHSLWIIDVGGPTYIVTYEGGGVTATDEQAVISSLKFLNALPTP